jgi:hypothetical protein
VKHVVHVHQQRIKKGLAAIIDRTYRGSTHHRQVQILCPSCNAVAATVVQSDTPDSCGARVWIEASETSHTEKESQP